MKVRSVIRPRVDDGQRRELEVEAATWEDAVAQLEAQTPDGWIRLHRTTVA